MTTMDDLPWPELGNVSRGATRGNQGQKGVLGSPDPDGRCVLQLRVQPGVLCVKLNRTASEWYRILDHEVNKALKLTKNFWRKARRRQDYDARADQDHMDLHEWLQQLKDKTMSHLELLMQKGDIQGPPYVMPDDVELTFLRKFIERQAAGIPHNPRMRSGLGKYDPFPPRDNSVDSITPEPSEQDYVVPSRSGLDPISDLPSYPGHSTQTSPSTRDPVSLAVEANSSTLQAARGALSRAQKDVQDAFLRYTACLDIEHQAQQTVTAAERRRDDIMALLLERNQTSVEMEARSRPSTASDDNRRSPPRYNDSEIRSAGDIYSHSRGSLKAMDWQEAEPQNIYPELPSHMEDVSCNITRKRTWDHPSQIQNGQYPCEGMSSLPPRKRVHHHLIQ